MSLSPFHSICNERANPPIDLNPLLLSEKAFNELVNRYGEAISIYFVFTYDFSKKIFDFLIKPITENLPKGSTLIFTKTFLRDLQPT
jgi:hypothetical protein